MEKKYIKIIKHLYENLQKKDKLKNEFESISYKKFLYWFGNYSFLCFILFSPISYIIIESFEYLLSNVIISIIFGFIMALIIMITKLKIFDNLAGNFAGKNLNKYNLFNLYGKNCSFDVFLYNIVKDIIDKTEKEDIKPYIKEINHIINSIPDESIRSNVKIKLIKKMEIDIDNQLISLIENQKEENLKIDSKLIVVN